MPVVPVHTSFLISKTLLNEVIGNLKVIFKSLLMTCTILGFFLIVCNQVKNLHVLQSCMFDSLRKHITTASIKYFWTYCKTYELLETFDVRRWRLSDLITLCIALFSGNINGMVREKPYRKKEFIQYYFCGDNLFQKLCLPSALGSVFGTFKHEHGDLWSKVTQKFWKVALKLNTCLSNLFNQKREIGFFCPTFYPVWSCKCPTFWISANQFLLL